jgi:hypothetical protein
MTTIIGDGFPDIRRLTSFEDAYRALGGPGKICALTGKSRACVWNWRKAGRFPARYYRVMRDVLFESGFVADMRLWDFASQHQHDENQLADVAA